ncbi:MAG: phosphatidylglycerophosphatase A, partial [Alphaproteobacteria bacterium]
MKLPLAWTIGSFFGIGRLPGAPGTWASLVALPLAWVLFYAGGITGLAIAVPILFAVGVWAARQIIWTTGKEDPSIVVVDEIVGQWIALLPIGLVDGEFTWWQWLAAFVLFRAFDILKPWPISMVDRDLKGG